MADAAPEKEIVIIRRRGGSGEDAHHGGVWKIAFADFMTAMMAFFLVLWLVNSTNKETKASIARYFNPIQFSDIAPRRGLQDAKEGGTGGSSTEAAKPDKKQAPGDTTGPIPGTKNKTPSSQSEGALFRDPYAVLAEIAGPGAGPGSGSAMPSPDPDGTGRARGEEGLTGGESYRDPFAPAARTALPAALDPLRPIFPPVTPPSPTGKREPLPPGEAPKNPTRPEEAKNPSPSPADVIEAPKLGAELAKALQEIAGPQAGPKIEVQSTAEGILISLTDEVDFGMFASGSAEPDKKVVRFMEKVAQSLKSRPGTIVLRGHTDSRPFKSAVYDNWRLSSARAHMAQYMLIRGGLDEKRIERVEGYADKRPRLAANPESAENRRIEILLRKDKP